MAINGVDMDRALSSASYAQQLVRSGALTAEQRGEIASKWGAETVNKWLSVDGTEYKIDDVSYDAAKEAGKKDAEKETGHDGSKGSVSSVVADSVLAGAATVGAVAPKILGGAIESAGNIITKGSAYTSGLGSQLSEKTNGIKNLSDIATVILASAVALKYRLNKPNKEQYDAAMQLFNANGEGGNLLMEGKQSLEDAQEAMTAATEEVTSLSEEAEEKNEEANDQIDKDKTQFDFYRTQYLALKTKADSGAKLTKDEKDAMKFLAPLMEGLSEDITTVQEENQSAVTDLHDEIGEYEEIYNDSAEQMASVEGLTDYAEGFDESTKTMANIEMVAQGVNAASAGAAAYRLATKGGLTFGATLAFAAMGTAAAVSSGYAAKEQWKWANEISQEIGFRREVQELGNETSDIYDQELDNYQGNLEVVEDLEIEVPDDLEIPADTTGQTENTEQSMAQITNNEKEDDDKKKNNPIL